MATPTLTNHNTAEQYRAIILDLTDMLVTGTGSITVSLSIDIAAGTLDYLPGSTGNVVLDSFGFGQYALAGTAAELSTSLANLGFIPTAGYLDTFTLQVVAGNAEGGVSGSKTISYGLADGDAITLANGVDHLFLFKTLVGSASVDGGDGRDTLLVFGASPLTIDFSQVGQQVISGSPSVTYRGFENLDAATASGVMNVTAGGGGAVIRTGSAADTVVLGAGADSIDSGDGDDQLSGGLTNGDNLHLGGGNDSLVYSNANASVDGGEGIDTLVASVSNPTRFDFAAVGNNTPDALAAISKFENLDGSAANAGLTVTLAASTTSILSGTGADSISYRDVVAVVNAGAGSDTLVLDIAQLSAPAASTAMTINLATANGQQITSGALLGSSWQNFEHLDASAWDKNLTVSANAAGSSIVTGLGADTITLGAGADHVDSGAGNDRLVGAIGAGDDIELGAGNDTASFASSALGVVRGGADVDTVLHIGSAATINLATNTHFTGFENLAASTATGVINFTGVAGTTAVTTGLANDVVNVAAATSAVTVNAGAGNNTVTTGSGDDTLTLGTGIDIIRTGAGNDTVLGTLSLGDRVLLEGGNDTISLPTTALAVTVDGGSGSDTLIVRGAAARTFNFAAGDDNGSAAGTYTNFENVNASAATGALTVTGVAGTTLVVTGSGADIINVAAAAQGVTIAAGAGINTITASAFNDVITLGSGKDTVQAGNGADTVNGALTAGDQVLLQGGNDTFLYRALSAAGTLVDGGTGVDTLEYTGTTAKTFNFSAAADNVAAETGLYKAFENLAAASATGAVTVTAAAATTRLETGSGADVVTATATTAGVRVDTGAGDDRITTGARNDTIVYGAGTDIVDAGAGIDTFEVDAGAGPLTIDLGVAAGTDQVNGASVYKNFENVDGGSADAALTITLANQTSAVITGSADDMVHTGAVTIVTGALDLGAGNDAVIVETSGTSFAGATLTAVESLLLANNVDVTLSIGQNALLTTAAGANTVTLANAGTVIGAADVEHYRLANGVNNFTLGSAAQNVTGGSGNDTVHTATLTSVNGTLALGGGADTLVIDTTATDLSAATLTAVENIVLASDVNATLTLAQNAVLGSAAGINTVSLSNAGNTSGAAEVETYHLAAGGNQFTLGAAGQNILGGSGDDLIKSGTLSAITATVDGAGGNDALLIEADATLAATLVNIEAVTMVDGVDLVTNIATNAFITTATGTNSVTLNEAGTATGAAQVENYHLANGGNTFTLGAAGQNVTGGSGDEVFNSDGLSSISGTLVGGGGHDVLNIAGSTTLSATLSGIATITLAANVDLGTTIADNALIGTALGSNFVTLLDAGVVTGAAQVEAYRLADGGNTFTLGEAAQSVVGGSGDDVVHSAGFTVLTGTYTLDGGNDSLVLDSDGTDLSGATLIAVEHITLATDVDATMSIAHNVLLGTASGNNTVTINAAGTATGAAQVENYLLANGANSFTLGAAAQNLTGGSGDDTVHSGSLTTISANLALGLGNDALVIDTSGTNISAASLSSVESIALANNVSATMTIAENALVTSAAGSNSVSLSNAGTATGAAAVENYQLATGVNSFTLGSAAQNVTGGSGNDGYNSGALSTLSGTLDGVSGTDVVNIEQNATLSATLVNIDSVNLANNVNLTTNLANNALLVTATGNNTVSLNEAGTATGAAQVENYQLANGTNNFTLATAAHNVTGGSGADTLHSGALTTLTGTLALAGGNDRLVIDTTGTTISAAVLTNVEAVELASNVSVTSSITNNALITIALGSNTVTLSEVGTASGASAVENYQLANGSNTFTLGASAQNVTGASGDDTFKTGALNAVTGVLDGVSGNDVVNVELSASLAATLTNIDAVTLATNVNLTTTIANNVLLTTALGSNTVTLSNAGTSSGAAQVENYQLATGANTFTLGAAGQNVTGASGDDSLLTGTLTTISGVLDGSSGNDVLSVQQSATLSATLANIDAVTLASNVNLTTTIGTNALLTTALGTNTVSLSDAGTTSGAAQVENYQLANGTNTFTLGAAAQHVTGGSGDDSFNSGALTTLSGTLDGVSGVDVVNIALHATLAASLINIDGVTLANNVNLTTNIVNNALLATASGNNTVTLSDTGTASGAAQVENYQLADGTNTFTLGASAQNVTGGSGDDTIHTGVLTTVSGSLSLAAGNDSLVIDTSGTNISSAGVSGVETITLASNVNATMSVAQHALLGTASGTNTVTLSNAGIATGAAQVEAYQLATGSNNFTLGANGQDVTGGTGADGLFVRDSQLSGAVIDGAADRDTLTVSSTAPGLSTINGTLSNIEVIDTTGVANGANLTAVAGLEEIHAGSGADTLNVTALSTGVIITAGSGADTITGGSGNDVIDVGSDADIDTVNAGGGSDTVTNFGAGDVINFEGGNDTVTYAAVTATVDGGAAIDTLTVTATTGAMTFDLSQVNAQQITAGGTGIYKNFENLAAGAAAVDDALTVTLASTTTAVTTGAGDDTITFRSQAVTVDAGAGSDTLILGGSGVIVVDLSVAGDQVSGIGAYGNFENLDAAASSATLVAIAGGNTTFVRTGSGNDSISGGVSIDGGAGNNNFTADSRTTTVVAGSGNDNLDASAAAQAVTVNLGSGTNFVLGSSHDDQITLGAGADTLTTGAGSDTIVGTLSAGDTIDLGANDDSFLYQALGSTSMVVDGGAGNDTLVVTVTSGAMTIDLSNSADQIAAEAGSYKNFEHLAAGSATNALTVTTAASGGVIVTGSGNDDVTLTAVSNTSVDTGAGDDIINVTAATINGDIDAGSNTGVGDTLNVLGGGTLAMSVTAIGIENVSLAVATNFTANALSGLAITGSSGNDTITVGANNQSVAGAGGDDLIKVTDVLLTGSLSVDGGAQISADTLEVTTDATVVDADLAQVSAIEILKLSADASDNAQSVTLASNAANGGLTTVDATAVGASDVITVDASGFANALTINTAAGNDVITLGAGGSVVLAGNGANTVTVGAANDGVHNDSITTGSGADLILTSDARLSASLLVAAGGGSDTLRVTTDGSIVDADLAQFSGIEVLQLGADAGDNAQRVSLATNAASAGLTTIDGTTAGANDAITVDASGFNNALVINTGAGSDVITLGSGGSVVQAANGTNTVTVGAANNGVQNDDITTGSGDDVIRSSDARLSSQLKVQAGGGHDTLEVTSDASVVDGELAQIASVEVLKLSADAGDNTQSVILAGNAASAGITTVDATAAAANDGITVDAGSFANALTINTAAGDDQIILGVGGSVVNAGAGANTVTVGAANDGAQNDAITSGAGDDVFKTSHARLTSHLTITAGAGNDTLEVISDTALLDAALLNITSIEVLKLSADAADNGQSLTLGANAAAAGLTTVDATGIGANDALSVDASGFANGLIINAAAGNDVITLGSGGSIVNAGNGANTVTVGAANDGVHDDAITTGSGNDQINTSDARLSNDLSVSAGGGTDTLQVTTDASVVDADLAQLSSVEILKLVADAGDNGQSIVLAGNAASAGVSALDARTAGADDVITIDASGFGNALIVDTGAGNDVITLGTGGGVVNAGNGANTVTVGAANDGVHDDNITTGSGADHIAVTTARLSSHLTIAAGIGSDTLDVSDDATVSDADFSQMSSVEVLKLSADAGDNAQSVTVASLAGDAGLSLIDLLSVGANDIISVDASGFSNALAVTSAASDDIITLGSGGSVVQAGNGSNTVTVGSANDGSHDDNITTGSGADLIKSTDARLTSHLVVNAGAGSDTLEVTDDAALLDADLTQILAVEILKLSADAGDNLQRVILASHGAAAGLTTIDATTAGPDDVINIDAGGFSNALTVNTGAGADVIILGSGGSVVNAANGSNTVTVGAANDGVHNDVITTGNSADLIKTTDARLTSALTLHTGGASDTLEVTTDAAVADADLTQILNLEVLKLSANADDDAQSVTLASFAASAGLTTLDATTAGANDVVTVDTSGFANALTINTGAGADAITLGLGGSVVNAGNGNNTVTVGAANDGVHDDDITSGSGDDQVRVTDARLTSNLSIAAGAGNDTLLVTTDATVLDGELLGKSNLEILKLAANAADDAQSVTLAGNAASAGITSVDATTAGADDDITLNASAFNNALGVLTGAGDDQIQLGSGGSVVTAGDGINVVTVGAANDGVHDDHITTGAGNDRIRSSDAKLSSHLVIDAGAGSDTLEVTTDASLLDADFTNFANVEVLKLLANAADDGQSIVVASNALAMGLTSIIGTSVGADDAITINASGFSGSLLIDINGDGDVVTLGSGGSEVFTGSGNDTITLGAATDVIHAGLGADLINVTATTIAADIDGGGDSVDVLRVTGGGTAVMGTNITGIEEVILAVATNFTANATASLIVLGSSGNDTVTVGAANQVISGVAGDDVVRVSDALLSASLTVDGGAASTVDTVAVSDDASVADADLTQVSTIEVLKLLADAGDNAQSVTLAAHAAAAGITTIDTTSVASSDVVTVNASAFANGLTITTGAGNDVILLGVAGSVVNSGDGADTVTVGADNAGVHNDSVSTGNGVDTIIASDAQLTSNLTVAAGAGTDTLRVTTDASIADAELVHFTALEVLQLLANAGDDSQSVTLAANAQSAGINAIDASSAGANDVINIDASAFDNALSVVTGSADDIIVLGSGGSVVSAGGGANTVTVGAANDGTHNDAITTGGGDDLIQVTDSKLSAHLSVAANGGNDTLEITSDAALADADLAQLTGIEILKLSANAGDNAQNVILAASALAMGLTTVDATAVGSSDAVTIDAVAFSGTLTVNSGAGGDTIVLGSGGSVVNTGDGNNFVTVGAANDGVQNDHITGGNDFDSIFVTNAQFNSHLVVSAGSNTDRLYLSDDASVIDADFTQLSAVEILLFFSDAADDGQTIVVAANAAAAGLTSIDASFAGADDVITIDASGFANDLNIVTSDAADIIVLGSGGSVVDASGGDNIVTLGAANDGVHDDDIATGNGADQINLTDAQLSSHLTLAGGGGVDTLNLSTDASVQDADLAQLDSVEVIKLGADAGDNAQSVTLAANAMAAGVTTVDASLAGSSDTVTLDASAYTQNLTIILHGGVDNVTLGTGNDTLLGGVSSGDIINLGAGNDSFALAALAAVTIDAGIDLDALVIGLGAGSRQIDFSNGLDQLSGVGTYLNFENLAAADANGQLSVIASTDTTSIVTGSKIDQVDAGLAAQGVHIATGASGDAIIGSAHNDTIDGGSGDDVMAGGAGNDNLTGGAGGDSFVFDTALNAATNVDTVMDFVSGNDVFDLRLDIFGALQSSGGVLNANNFRSGAGAVATTASQHIILDTSSGSLYYDADGSGGVAQIEFARLGGAHFAVATDFVVA